MLLQGLRQPLAPSLRVGALVGLDLRRHILLLLDTDQHAAGEVMSEGADALRELLLVPPGDGRRPSAGGT